MNGCVDTIQRAVADEELISTEAENTIFSETCAMLIYSMIPEHFERMFVSSILTDETVHKVGVAMDILKTVVSDDIRASAYSSATKTEMLNKVDRLHVRIGSQSPKYWFNPTPLLHEHTRNKEDISLVQLGFDIRSLSVQDNINLIFSTPGPNGDPEKSPFAMPPTVANAWHNPQDMTINIPVGILNTPMYHEKYSDTSMMAKIIAICAHEFGHAFDHSAGFRFDSYGNAREWVHSSDIGELNKKIDCLVRQYSRPSRHGYIQNGMDVLSEAMADTYGINWAYKALLKAKNVQSLSKDEILLFATMYAQLWATNSSPEDDRKRVLFDEHPLPEFRINLNLQNLKAFSNMCNKEPTCSLF